MRDVIITQWLLIGAASIPIYDCARQWKSRGMHCERDKSEKDGSCKEGLWIFSHMGWIPRRRYLGDHWEPEKCKR